MPRTHPIPVLLVLASLLAASTPWARERPRHVTWPEGRPGHPVCRAEGEAVTYRARGSHFHLRPDGHPIRYGDGLVLVALREATVVRMNGRRAVTLEPNQEWMITPGDRPLDLESTGPVTLLLVRSDRAAGLRCEGYSGESTKPISPPAETRRCRLDADHSGRTKIRPRSFSTWKWPRTTASWPRDRYPSP